MRWNIPGTHSWVSRPLTQSEEVQLEDSLGKALNPGRGHLLPRTNSDTGISTNHFGPRPELEFNLNF